MKRVSTKSGFSLIVALTVIASLLGSAPASAESSSLTLELDLRQLAAGTIPAGGLGYNSFLTITSPDGNAQVINGEPEFSTGAIGIFPGQVAFNFDSEEVEILSFSYGIFNNNAPSTAIATGTTGSGLHSHPNGMTSQTFEGIGNISRVMMQSLESIVGDVVIEFTGPGPDGDSDGDGVEDGQDNCLVVFNLAQLDTDDDGFGNDCDADLNNDNVVNFLDLGQFRKVFGAGGGDAENADFNGDGEVNFIDLEIMRADFFGPPGPSAVG